MKKVFSIWSLAMLMVMCVGFASCSKDENKGGNGGMSQKDFSKQIVGKWKYFAYYHDGWNVVENGNYIQFNSDGTLSSSNYKTWKVIGEGSTIFTVNGNDIYSYKVELSGDPMNNDQTTWDICFRAKPVGWDSDYPDFKLNADFVQPSNKQ